MSIAPGTHVMYTIRPGDTLYSIANQFGSSVEAIVQANALYPPITEPDYIRPGQKVLVRVPGTSQQSVVLHQVTEGDTMFHLAERYSVGLDLLAAVNQMQHPDILRVAQLIYIPAFVHEVEQGDSLYAISRRYGVTLNEIIRANQGRLALSADLIYPQFKLVIPLPSSTNIAVFSPLPGSVIADGSVLSGVARAFEATVLYQIKDEQERTVTNERFFTASAGGPAFGQFQASIEIDQTPQTANGTLLVYTRSAKDGSIQDLVEVPVKFNL